MNHDPLTPGDDDREVEDAKRELADAIRKARRSNDRRAMQQLEQAKARARRVVGGHSGRYTPPARSGRRRA